MTTPAPESKPVSGAAGIVTVLLTLLGWSSVPLFITHFSKSIDIWTSNGWRYGFSALLWAPVLLWQWKRRRLPRGLWAAARVPALFNSAGQVVFAWSFYKIDPATATFGLRMQIVFVAVGAYLLFPSERAVLRRPLTWLGIAMVLAGIAGTIFAAPVERAQTHAFGVALALSGGLMFAGYGLAVRRYMHSFHPVTAFASISQYTALTMVSLMLILGERSGLRALDPAVLSREQFGLLLLSAIIGIALGHVFYYISIARLGVAVSSGVIQLQPFCVALGSHLLLDQPITRLQLAFGSFAVAGAMLMLGVQNGVSRAARRQPGGPVDIDGVVAAGQDGPPPGSIDADSGAAGATPPVASAALRP